MCVSKTSQSLWENIPKLIVKHILPYDPILVPCFLKKNKQNKILVPKYFPFSTKGLLISLCVAAAAVDETAFN